MNGAHDLLAMDGLKVIGTIGFFVPAAILVTFVVVAIIRDRRLVAREEAEEAAEAARQREALGGYQDVRGERSGPTPPPAG
ncbi:hypothetical protein [Blastococcus sp. TF02A-30]|uniref:hypothetical protein n=1 Tax=Blastococcus sp. TF02A-30 TaxID=2250580 RepID=UPI000DEB2C52|nr:hypothetical protein [Blastococcus sp. TF02A-30]RBY89338.1 hypothetical protein DQ241_07600 [Blastococcus sp. TF02A-30]